ncbi:MAG: 2-keto-4-pentenoate hydratase [bacterium]
MTDCIDILWDIHNNPAAGYDLALATPERVKNFPQDTASGQQLQLQLLARWLERGEHLGGWKIGMTSGASRNAMGNGIRPFGFILQSRIKTSSDPLSVHDLHRGQIENELCFRISSTLGEGATPAEAKNCVAEILPAFEINQKRLGPDAAAPLRIADNLSNWGIVIGDPVPPATDISHLRVTLAEGTRVIETIASKGHIDDHYESLAILANQLALHGQTLEAGQYVITGAYGKTPFAAGRYTGHFDSGVGSVDVQLV